MDETNMLTLLRADLQRQGFIQGEPEYLTQLLRAAKCRLERQGIKPCEDHDWVQAVVSTAAWMYRKRINGEPEPAFLRTIRHDLLVSQKMRGDDHAP